MNKLLTFAVACLLAGTFSLADASPQQHNIDKGGCILLGLPIRSSRSDPDHFAMFATVKWFGNSYGRDKNGMIFGTCKLCDWESCYIVVNGKTILVVGLPGDIVEQQGYNGQTLFLRGRLIHQKGEPNSKVPSDVLMVDYFSSVGC